MNEDRVAELVSIFGELAALSGGLERTSIFPNLTVVDAAPANLPAQYIIIEDNEGFYIPALKVPGVTYAVNDTVNVLFIKGTEPIAFQQGSESPGGGATGWPFTNILTVSSTDPDADYPDIDSAIAGAAAGSIVLLDAETYSLTTTITVNKALAIMAWDRGIFSGSKTLITSSVAGPTLDITTSGVVLIGLVIKNTGSGGTQGVVRTNSSFQAIGCQFIKSSGNPGGGGFTYGVHQTGGTAAEVLDTEISCNTNGTADYAWRNDTATGGGQFIRGRLNGGTKDIYSNQGGATFRFADVIIAGNVIDIAGTYTGVYFDNTLNQHFAGSGGTGQYVKQSTANGVLSVGAIGQDDAKVSKLVASDGSPDPALGADASGYLSAAVQPLFLAYNSAADNDVTGDGTAYTVIFDTEITDRNSNYNNSTGVFTAPVAGHYLFVLAIGLQDIAAGHVVAQISIIASNRTFVTTYINAGNSAADGFLIINGSAIVDMDAGDTVSVSVLVNGSTKTVNVYGSASTHYTFIGGYLLP